MNVTTAKPIVGASPLPSSVREGFAQHTGVRLLEGDEDCAMSAAERKQRVTDAQ